ncbi:succinate dehydrogenase [Roseibium sp. SCP14]|uniref:succinate dehydrogenase n=1 Tax=Roseibium sp. SCP14 TaxID=3141375 RepID=UPI00333D24EB
MLNMHLYMAQRLTAMLMAPLVLGHIAVMIYAIQGGLSAEEILSRTQGSVAWFLFYGLFVIAVSVHGAIGLRVITHEMTGLRGWGLWALTWGFGLTLMFMGARAVMAVTGL